MALRADDAMPFLLPEDEGPQARSGLAGRPSKAGRSAPTKPRSRFKTLLFGKPKDEKRAEKAAKNKKKPARPWAEPAMRKVWAVRGATALLWFAVILGALGGGYAFLASGSKQAAPPKVPASTVGAEGFAERCISTYLTSTGGDVQNDAAFKECYPLSVDWREMNPNDRYVTGTSTVNAAEIHEGYWSITVAARLAFQRQEEDGSLSNIYQTAYYALGVRETEVSGRTVYVATSLPARVPAPLPVPERPLTEVFPTDPELAADQLAAVQGFMNGFLTGSGDLDRYITKGLIRAIDPAPYATVEVISAGSRPFGDNVLVAVEVSAVTASGSEEILNYTLEMTQIDDKWLALYMHTAPPLKGTGSDAGDSDK